MPPVLFLDIIPPPCLLLTHSVPYVKYLVMLLLLLTALVGGPYAVLGCTRLRERFAGHQRTAGANSSAGGGAAAAWAVSVTGSACEQLDEHVLTPALGSWWHDRARPALGAAALSVEGWATRVRAWMGSSRVHRLAPGSVALPMATIDEDLDGAAEEDDTIA